MPLRPRAHIHLSHIAENWRSLQGLHPNGQTGAVVKADAYGHGIQPVCDTLHAAGCDHFFTAHGFEGEQVRRTLGPHPDIYVLNGPAPDEETLYRSHALIPIINSPAQFETLCHWISGGHTLPRGYALHFDTGMNRLGLAVDDAAALAEASRSAPPKLLLSHFACADNPEDKLNTEQAAAFAHICTHFPDTPRSLANSAGIWLDGDAHHHQLSRPGIALYGGGRYPTNLDLKPGLTLEAPILQIRQVRAGQSVGYGASFGAQTDLCVATIALGYGDGFPRAASNHGFAMLGDIACPIIGRVSMDLITLNISQARDLARTGHYVQLIGAEAPLERQAECAGTIGYELLTGLTPRVTRIYS